MYAPAIGRASLTERTVLAGREVFLGRRRGPLAMLPFVGPAVIASIAYMDPGNFATNIQAGAKYGYELLWVALSANLVAMLFQALFGQGRDRHRAQPRRTVPRAFRGAGCLRHVGSERNRGSGD